MHRLAIAVMIGACACGTMGPSAPDAAQEHGGGGGGGGGGGAGGGGAGGGGGGGGVGSGTGSGSSDGSGGGGGGGVVDAGVPVSFSHDVRPIIDHCGAGPCHGGNGPSWPYTTLVNAPATECPSGDARVIVVASDSAHSYLLDKLAGTDMCTGVRMPKGETPLTDTEIATITTWIAQGALDN